MLRARLFRIIKIICAVAKWSCCRALPFVCEKARAGVVDDAAPSIGCALKVAVSVLLICHRSATVRMGWDYLQAVCFVLSVVDLV